VSRSDKLDTSRMCSWWSGEAREWARRHGQSVDIKPSHLTLAVLCHGDIPHSYDPARYPHDLSFGLNIGTSKLPTGSGWLSVLERSAFRPATALPNQPIYERPRNVRVREIPRDYVGLIGRTDTW